MAGDFQNSRNWSAKVALAYSSSLSSFPIASFGLQDYRIFRSLSGKIFGRVQTNNMEGFEELCLKVL